jgi:hypothetical protein
VRQWAESFAQPTLADAEAPWRAALRGGLAGMAEAASEQLTPLNVLLTAVTPARALAAGRPALQALRAVAREAPIAATGRWPGLAATDLGRMPADAGAELERALSAARTLAGSRPARALPRGGSPPIDLGPMPSNATAELEQTLAALRRLYGS